MPKIRIRTDHQPLRGWMPTAEVRKLGVESGSRIRWVGHAVEEFCDLCWGPIFGVVDRHWSVIIDNQIYCTRVHGKRGVRQLFPASPVFTRIVHVDAAGARG